ncbi:hypothetical protein SAMN04487901_10145 [Prevotella communis]|jgi:hypothetical protein|uniref:Uncharacterized protein n=1 Tax=Prevotella communis TaxID=2913614 RepID=A0A1G7RP52_9BACT|nr:hypothetical protein [Prevotella communis]MBO6073811.1 hypothetical protein [Paludibacteraceae bacterium]SDG12567.1 hypothetical protein SAMN04487901_10145 [Prevotella communis]
MSTQQLIIFIGMVAFIAFGVWLQFRMKFDIKENEREYNKKFHEWIKAHPNRSNSLGYTHKEKENVKEEA